MDYGAFIKNITDVVREEQAKLGYLKERIVLYYPLSALNNIFKSDMTEEQMLTTLNGIPQEIKAKFGEFEVACKKGRFSIALPPKTSEYVHESTPKNEFIFALVKKLNGGANMEDIFSLFKEYGKNASMKKSDNPEFDRVMRLNTPEDDYVYCFKDEGVHITYHRFSPEDYASLAGANDILTHFR